MYSVQSSLYVKHGPFDLDYHLKYCLEYLNYAWSPAHLSQISKLIYF